jgi:hypothetical protein
MVDVSFMIYDGLLLFPFCVLLFGCLVRFFSDETGTAARRRSRNPTVNI